MPLDVYDKKIFWRDICYLPPTFVYAKDVRTTQKTRLHASLDSENYNVRARSVIS